MDTWWVKVMIFTCPGGLNSMDVRGSGGLVVGATEGEDNCLETTLQHAYMHTHAETRGTSQHHLQRRSTTYMYFLLLFVTVSPIFVSFSSEITTFDTI